LILDPSHTFALDHPSNTEITIVRTVGPADANKDGSDLRAFHTDTTAAQELLKSFVAMTVAAGIKLRIIIKTPEIKWPIVPDNYPYDRLFGGAFETAT
jgi:hypothetical protein